MTLTPTSSRTALPLSRVQLSFTDAQIKALPTVATYQTVIAAPGANTIVVPTLTIIELNTTAGAYAGVDADAFAILTYGDYVTEATTLMRRTPFAVANTYVIVLVNSMNAGDALLPTAIEGITPARANIVNLPVKLVASNTANFTGGNAANTLRVTCYYATISLA